MHSVCYVGIVLLLLVYYIILIGFSFSEWFIFGHDVLLSLYITECFADDLLIHRVIWEVFCLCFCKTQHRIGAVKYMVASTNQITWRQKGVDYKLKFFTRYRTT